MKLLGKEVHDLDTEKKNVLKSIAEQSLSSRDAADVAKDGATFGEHLSDRVAKVGGSWSFIIAFSVVLIGWMLLNNDVLTHWGMAFDPYPLHFSQSDARNRCRDTGSDNYDEPEPPFQQGWDGSESRF